MTNYEQLFQTQMQHREFENAYSDARLERFLHEMLDSLKERILRNEPKENLLQEIETMQKQIDLMQTA